MLYMVLLYNGTGAPVPKLHNLSENEAEQKSKEMYIAGHPAFFIPQNSTHLMVNPTECAVCYQEINAALHAVRR